MMSQDLPYKCRRRLLSLGVHCHTKGQGEHLRRAVCPTEVVAAGSGPGITAQPVCSPGAVLSRGYSKSRIQSAVMGPTGPEACCRYHAIALWLRAWSLAASAGLG
jgi:hypothetical protein